MSERPVLLAIEDDPSIVELLSTIAAPLDLQVVEATDGATALGLLDHLRPALVSLDLVLPDVDGFAVLEVVRSRPALADVPILVITALGDTRNVKRAYDLGATDLIHKPFNVGVVESKLRTFLRMVRLGEELRQRQQFLEEVMEQLSSGLLVCDAQGRVQRLNPAGASALGLSDAQAPLGHALADVAPGAEVMLADAPSSQQRRVRVAGAHVLGFTTTRLDDGAVVAVFRELSAAEAARREADERARHEALAGAARSFAHEVRNPLAAIAAAAQVIVRDDADAALKRRLARAVETEALRITGLVREYVERQAPIETIGGADLRALLEEVAEVNLLGNPARDRVSVDLPPALPLLRIDPARLKQVVINLVDNAVAATERGGAIVVAAVAQHGGVQLTVHDTGEGIAAEVLPRIFDANFTTRPGGNGLGLAIARRIVEDSGGTISVDSASGLGSVFTVWLRALK